MPSATYEQSLEIAQIHIDTLGALLQASDELDISNRSIKKRTHLQLCRPNFSLGRISHDGLHLRRALICGCRRRFKHDSLVGIRCARAVLHQVEFNKLAGRPSSGQTYRTSCRTFTLVRTRAEGSTLPLFRRLASCAASSALRTSSRLAFLFRWLSAAMASFGAATSCANPGRVPSAVGAIGLEILAEAGKRVTRFRISSSRRCRKRSSEVASRHCVLTKIRCWGSLRSFFFFSAASMSAWDKSHESSPLHYSSRPPVPLICWQIGLP